MISPLLQQTATLIVKLPEEVSLPAYNEKPRARKNFVRNIVQIMQSATLELVYVGIAKAESPVTRECFGAAPSLNPNARSTA